MKKSTKLITGLAVGVALLIVGMLIAYLLLRPKTATQPVNVKTRLLYYVPSSLPNREVIASKLANFADSKYEVAETDTTNADIVVSEQKSDGSVGLVNKTASQAILLGGPEIVNAQETPTAYITFKEHAANLAQSQKDALTKLVSDAFSVPITWSLNIAGDIIIGRTVYEQESRRNDFTSSFHKVKDLLGSTDYTVANAEWTAADGIAYPLAGLSFASPARSLDGLTYAGIDAVSLANNHSMNGGVVAFEQMLTNLQTRNIGFFGAGKNFTEAHTPYIADIKGVKVAFLGYTAIPGNVEVGPSTTGNAFIKITPWYPFTESYIAQMESDIKAAKTKADVVIPYFHWSEEYTHLANEQMRQVAHRAVDAGATMVVGSHPHWVQGVEWYNNRLITYSLGNFVFDQEQSLKTKQGVVLTTGWSGTELIDAKLTPIQIEQYYQPRILEGAPSQEVLNNIYSHSWWPILE